MSTRSGSFNEIATQYDRYRPRYPEELAAVVADGLRAGPRVVDVGAGTGIVLEWLLPRLETPEVQAVDISEGMVDAGRKKFPFVKWHVGRVEDVLPSLGKNDLIVAGQAYQWFEREEFLDAAYGSLAEGGRLAVIQNNRVHVGSEMLSAYEDLLETNSPGYTRGYRDIDIFGEMAGVFGEQGTAVRVERRRWSRSMQVDDFVGMASSSTQVQRAVDAKGPGVLDDIRSLSGKYAIDGVVSVPYETELFIADR
ncbi:class I SAM-dependent methyltransferase [Micrococcus luteus]|uniref:class I SAM-dependent methyltransferase n=1 Tax=Micrococcus luteus TaxID=1270 RepID=UPI0033D8350D